MARPGIMLYFDILEPIRVLPDADKGRLLVAMLEYGQSGKVPQFDGELGLTLAWGFVKPKIDKDSEEYSKTVLKRQYATFCRDRKKRGEPEITFEEWQASLGGGSYQMVSHDNTWCPTTTTTTAESGGDSPERNVKVMGGELGKGVVFLSEKQTEDLLDKMDLETFNYYVDKLSTFIIDKGAHVKNHYETILKWWREDSGLEAET